MEETDMRIFGVLLWLLVMILFIRVPPVQAVEEGQLIKKDGKWGDYSGEEPGLKYLYLKGIITEDEYNKGLKVLESRERISKPNFNIDVNNGLNIRVGEKFLLKVRLLTQARYSYSTFNDAWGTVGNSRNPEILGGQVEFRAFKRQSDSSQFTVPRVRLQFLGHAFDPDFRYNVSVALDSTPWNQEGGNGRAALQDAYISSWHIPWATLQVGQQTVWFNRALISSIATSTFADNMIVQNMFASNLQNSRDVGITVLSNEDQYTFNYAFGIWGGVGPNLARDGTAVSQNVLPQTGTPRAAIAFGYAYDPAQNYLSSIRSDIVDRSYRQAVTAAQNGRLLGGGIYDFQTYETDFIAKYQGWSLQAEAYYRHQRVRNKDAGTSPFDLSTIPTSPLAVGPPVDLGQAWGWYVQVGKYVIPRKLELAVCYGVLDPSTKKQNDLTKEFGASINYSFDGTYNNRLVVAYSNLPVGRGG